MVTREYPFSSCIFTVEPYRLAHVIIHIPRKDVPFIFS